LFFAIHYSRFDPQFRPGKKRGRSFILTFFFHSCYFGNLKDPFLAIRTLKPLRQRKLQADYLFHSIKTKIES
jgi:hypothetical protein